jgi:hypothetical protein
MNALHMKDNGFDVKVVIEGTATLLIKELTDPTSPAAKLYRMVKATNIIDCVCRACSANFGALESAKEQGLNIYDEMSGHASIAR